MSVFKKIGKALGITCIVAGGIGTAAFGSLLGLGANYTVSDVQEANGPKPAITMVRGVGSLNYGKVWFDGQPAPVPPQKSYQEFVNNAQQEIIELNELIDTTKKEWEKATDEATKKKLEENIVTLIKLRSVFDATIKANKMMISGAVMTSITIAILLIGIVLLVVTKKQME